MLEDSGFDPYKSHVQSSVLDEAKKSNSKRMKLTKTLLINTYFNSFFQLRWKTGGTQKKERSIYN